MEENRSESFTNANICEELESLKAQLAEMKNKLRQVPKIQNPACILQKDTSYDVWRKIVENDFRTFGYLYLIDKNETKPTLSTDEETSRSGFAMGYLISRLDDEYKRLVCDINEPMAILEKLDSLRHPKIPSNKFILKRSWSNLTYLKGKETATQFITRFEEATRNLMRVTEGEIKEEDILENFLMAIYNTVPEVIRRYDASGGKISLNEIKSMMLNTEATETEAKARCEEMETAVALNASAESRDSKRSGKFNVDKGKVCYRCGKPNHMSFECKSRAIICYNCKELTTNHDAKTCRKRKVIGKNRVGYNFKMEQRGRSSGRRMYKNIGNRKSYEGSQIKEDNRRGLYKKVKLSGKEGEKPKFAFIAMEDLDVSYAENLQGEGEANAAEVEGENFSIPKNITFLADSGANEHLVNNLNYLTDLEKVENEIQIKGVNSDKGADLKIKYKGVINVKLSSGRVEKLKNVLYSKHLSKNLFSLRKLVNKGALVNLSEDGINIVDVKSNKLVKSGRYDGRFWWLNFELANQTKYSFNSESYVEMHDEQSVNDELNKIENDHNYHKTAQEHSINEEHNYSLEKDFSFKEINDEGKLERYIECVSEMNKSDLEEINKRKVESLKSNIGLLWHYRLGHVSKSYLEQMSKINVELRNVKFTNDILECDICKRAKIVREPCKSIRYKYDEPLRLIHTDVMGPITPSTFKFGNTYIVTFIDDFTRYAWAYPMANKSMVHIALGSMLENARTILGKDAKITFLRLDNGTEYFTENMKLLVEKEKISFREAPPYTPNLNGTAERFNLDIQQKIRSLLFDSGFPLQLWGYALNFAVNVYNKTPKRSLGYNIPYEMIHKRSCSIKYFRRFGCLSYVLNTKTRGKFNDRSVRGFLVACGETSYYIIEPETGKVYRSKNVNFIESKTYGNVFVKGDKSSVLSDPNEVGNTSQWLICEDKLSLTNRDNIGINVVREHFGLMCEKFVSESQECMNETLYDNESDIEAFMAYVENEPSSYKDAKESVEWKEWEKAIEDEFNSLTKNETWVLIERNELPVNQNILKSRWVFKKKNESSVGIKYKARLVIKGFADKNKYDLTETFAPVARLSDVKFILSVANKYNLDIHQMDVKTAFLNGKLEKPVYMEIPEGYKGKENLDEKYVCKLIGALYGLKISPRRWYERFRVVMKKLYFEIYEFQPCIFTWRKNGKFVILLLYVDDILMVGNCKNKMDQTKNSLSKEFEMVYLGCPKKFLGIEVKRDIKNKTMFLSQRDFMLKMLERFGMNESKPVRTPMVNVNCSSDVNEVNKNETYPYRQAIGSLLYLSNGTRPDITYAVNVLSRKQVNFNHNDWIQVKRVFRYLKGTLDFGLKYKSEKNDLECYVDASLGMNDEAGKSTSGLIIMLFGDVIYWRSKKQSHVALSSSEAEYIAMSLACKELTCYREMCRRLIKFDIVPTLYEDSNAAIKLAKSEESRALKHIVKLCYHYVRLEVANKNLIIKWVSTKEQLADILTKALGYSVFEKLRNSLIAKYD